MDDQNNNDYRKQRIENMEKRLLNLDDDQQKIVNDKSALPEDI